MQTIHSYLGIPRVEYLSLHGWKQGRSFRELLSLVPDFDHSREQGEENLVLLAGPLNAMYVWDLLGFTCLRTLCAVGVDRQECSIWFIWLSVSKMLFTPILSDRFWMGYCRSDTVGNIWKI